MADKKQSVAAGRRQARVRAMQALYQLEMAGGNIAEILAQFFETQEMDRVDTAYFENLFRGVCGHQDDLDHNLIPFLDRSLSELDAIERSILRLAAFECVHQLDVPYRVVINEAVELAKKFGAEQGHKFVNGVVDKLARQTRSLEVASHQREA